jgi:hypothetical protein
MKTRGSAELGALLKRVRLLRALGRVEASDADFIVEKLQAVAARIVSMPEDDERGEALP